MGPREAAQAAEYHQQYVELLEELEQTVTVQAQVLDVEVNEQRVRFPGIDNLAEWLTEVMWTETTKQD